MRTPRMTSGTPRALSQSQTMEPEHIRFGGGATETMLNPLVAVGMAIVIALILISRRNKGITPFLLACFSIPVGQVIVLGGLHFTVLRVLIMAGLVRRATLGGSSSVGRFPGGFSRLDLWVVLWTISALVVLSLQWMNSQALTHNLGDFLDAFGGYLVIRFFIPDGEAVRRAIWTLAIVCFIQGAFMLNELVTHVNVFSYLGGAAFTMRDGKVRSQGVMGCIYAGALAGALVPVFLSLWNEKKYRPVVYAGVAGALAMVGTSNSSTSLLALAGSVLGLGLWPLRRQMQLVRRGFALTLVALHLVMHGPVWSLIARVDLTGSSSGYHRYYLVDNCIRHFSDWWLLGYKDYNLWGWDMWDLCNQFVEVALTGGLLTLILYIAIFKRGFSVLGTARKQVEGECAREWFLWCLASALFSVVVSYFGINCTQVMMMGIFTVLACISVAVYEACPATASLVETAAEAPLVNAGGPAAARASAPAIR